MRISFFLQTITPANKNHYQASKNMFEVATKLLEKGAEVAIQKCSLK